MNFNQSNLIGKDALLKINEWKEMARLLGIPGCKYMYFLEGTKTFSIHGEIQGIYSEPQDISLIYLEVPDQETATTLGWVSEIPDDKPYIIQLPYDTPHLETGCRVSIPYAGDSQIDGEDGESRVFRVTRVYTMSRYPNCRMCQLAPEVNSSLVTDVADLHPENNYNYLKINQND